MHIHIKDIEYKTYTKGDQNGGNNQASDHQIKQKGRASETTPKS